MQRIISVFQDRRWAFLLMGIYAVIISYPFRVEGMAIGHDFAFHTQRISSIADELSGQFPVRIYGEPLYGYGVPTGIFYPSLFLYIPALLHLAGLTLFEAYGVFGLLLNLITVYLNCWAFSRLFDSIGGGVIAAFLYESCLYRLIDFYSRSALGEMLAFTFFPAACISIWLLLRNGGKYWIHTVLLSSCILQSHLISSVYLFGVGVILSAWQWRAWADKYKRRVILKALVFIILLNVWFYVPLFWYMNHIHFFMQNLWTPLQSWTINNRDWLCVAQGFVGYSTVMLLLVVSTVVFWQRHNIPSGRKKLYWYMLLLGVVCDAAAMEWFPWEELQAIPHIGYGLSFMQIPFRMLMFTDVAFTICLTIGLMISGKLLSPICRNIVVALCIVMVTVTNINFFGEKLEASFAEFTREEMALGKIDFSIVTMNLYDPSRIKEATKDKSSVLDYVYSDLVINPAHVINDKGRIRYVNLGHYLNDFNNALADFQKSRAAYVLPANITNFRRCGTHIEFDYKSSATTPLELPLLYYPGYAAYLDGGRKLSAEENAKHRLQVVLPQGQGHIALCYEGTKLFRIMDMVSLMSLLVFAVAVKKAASERAA